MRESTKETGAKKPPRIGVLATCLYCLLASACATSDAPRVASTEAIYRGPQQLDDGWRVASPEDFGLERAPLEKLTEVVRSGIESPNVHGLLIAKDGRLIYEE